jgi:hypothetical protein
MRQCGLNTIFLFALTGSFTPPFPQIAGTGAVAEVVTDVWSALTLMLKSQ